VEEGVKLEIVKFKNRLYGVRKTIPSASIFTFWMKRCVFLKAPPSTNPDYLRLEAEMFREWREKRDTWIKTGDSHLDLCGFQTYPDALHSLNRILDKYDIGTPCAEPAK
jgi:hypothetical protein